MQISRTWNHQTREQASGSEVLDTGELIGLDLVEVYGFGYHLSQTVADPHTSRKYQLSASVFVCTCLKSVFGIDPLD